MTTLYSLPTDSLVWDNHACMPLRPGDESFLHQLDRHKSAGTSVLSLNVTFDLEAGDPLLGFKMLSQFRSYVRRHPDDYLLIETVDDVLRAKQQGKLGICFDIEGGTALEDDPKLVGAYYDLGVRWMLIAYNQTNKLGGGCQDEDTGLTDFGRRVIDEMEAVGMVLCCSHTGYRTAREAIEYSKNPVIFSHSNPLAVHDHARNVPDDLIKAVAASGGVMSLNGVGIFLGANDASTQTFVRHVNYVADLVGEEHVGLGLDYVFDQEEAYEAIRKRPDLYPPDKGYANGIELVEPERIPDIAEALIKSGWSERALRGFLGENNLRVAQQVWRK